MTRLFIVVACLVVASSASLAQDSLARLQKQLDSKKAEERTAALVELAELGPKAAPAVDALAGFLNRLDEEERILATLALGKIGKASLPPVVKLLDHEDEMTRFYAVWTLAMIGKDAKDLTPRILTLLAKDPEEDVRVKSVYALARVAPDSRAALDALIELAMNKKAPLPERLASVEGLRYFGKGAIAPLVKTLREAGSLSAIVVPDFGFLPGQEFELSIAASESLVHLFNNHRDEAFARALTPHLGEILNTMLLSEAELATHNALTQTLAKQGEKLLPDLQKRLVDKEPSVRLEAAGALARLGAHLSGRGENADLQQSIVNVLKPHFTSPDVEMRMTVVGQAPVNAATQSAFEERVLDDDAQVRSMAFGRLAQAGSDVTPKLRKLMKAAKGDDRLRYASALLMFTGEAEFENLLWDNLAHKDPAIRHRVACYLASASARPEDRNRVLKTLIPVLVESLKSESAEKRLQAMQAFQSLAWALDGQATHILDRLNDPSPQVKLFALQLLEFCGNADPKRSLQRLTPLAGQDDPVMRQRVVQALRGLGKDGVPLLAQIAQNDKDPTVWRTAVEVLGQIGPQAEAAVPALIKLAEKDEYWHATTFAIAQIAPDESYPHLLKLLLKRDESLRKTLAYPQKVVDNPAALTDAMLNDWKKSDLKQCRVLTEAMTKIAQVASTKQLTSLVFASSPVVSTHLDKVEKALRSKEVKDRLDAVAALGAIRQWHPTQPRIFPADDKKWLDFQERNAQQARRIEDLFSRARRDSDLQLRRLARRLHIAPLEADAHPFLPGRGFGP